MAYQAITTDTVQSMVGRIAYATGIGYLYVVGVFGDTVLGVFTESNGDGTWKTENKSLPLSSFEDSWSYDLSDFGGWVEPLTLHFQSPSNGEAGASEAALAEARRQGASEAREAALREFETWKARATSIAHEYAENNSLCGEFDRCMEDIGLEPRVRVYDVTVHVCGTTTVTVEASSSEEAGDIVSDDPWSYVDVYSVRDDASVDIQDVERQ